MSEINLLSVSVTICGRTYPLRVEEGDVELMKSIAKEINEKIREFQSSYKNRDLQDLLTMTLLTYALDFHQSESDGQSIEIKEIIHSINSDLQKALSS
ncbi:MAG: cell division protein ZapA [Saprospirales bacterium]|jgi:cell division protein ZapA (FtsZ GTPase activity inhibitor)|nr:MAG: cell division protein ZapA [Saprospirales bacterium]